MSNSKLRSPMETSEKISPIARLDSQHFGRSFRFPPGVRFYEFGPDMASCDNLPKPWAKFAMTVAHVRSSVVVGVVQSKIHVGSSVHGTSLDPTKTLKTQVFTLLIKFECQSVAVSIGICLGDGGAGKALAGLRVGWGPGVYLS